MRAATALHHVEVWPVRHDHRSTPTPASTIFCLAAVTVDLLLEPHTAPFAMTLMVGNDIIMGASSGRPRLPALTHLSGSGLNEISLAVRE